MPSGISITVTAADRAQLLAIRANRNSPQKHVWRGDIILLTADGHGTAEIMRRAGVAKTAEWRWAGAVHDRGRGRPSARQDTPLAHPAAAARDRRASGRAHARPAVRRDHAPDRAGDGQSGWHQHQFGAAHLARSRPAAAPDAAVKLSTDPHFAEKLRDIVGLYLDPPAHAVVLSLDEKSQIQALDRTQPGLPLKRGRCGTMTHDYKRNGTTTLFAALDVLEGRGMQRHRHQEFIRFLNAIEARVPAGKLIHAILDNYTVHKHPKVREWLARHPRWTFHFTPTSASWLDAVEGFFAKLTQRRLKRGVFHSPVSLQEAINRFLAEANANPRPFRWTKAPDKIIAAVRRWHQALNSIH